MLHCIHLLLLIVNIALQFGSLFLPMSHVLDKTEVYSSNLSLRGRSTAPVNLCALLALLTGIGSVQARSFHRHWCKALCAEMHGPTQSTTDPVLCQENCWNTMSPHSTKTLSKLINLWRGVISITERFTMVQLKAPDSYRSLYLSRAISQQMGLKLMGVDTATSRTFYPSGFIALTFEKVGLCVRRCGAGLHIEHPWDPGFKANAGDADPPRLCPTPTTFSIMLTFMNIKNKRKQIIALQHADSLAMGDIGFCCCCWRGGCPSL